MATFTDFAGRDWLVDVTVPTIKHVRDRLNVELLDVIDPQSDLMKRLFRDPCFLCDILFVVCESQAKDRNVTDEEFGRSLRGNALDAATEALLASIADFFPDGRKAILRELMAKMRNYGSRVIEAAAERLKSPELNDALEAAFQKAVRSMNSASGSPGSPASIHSANQD